MKTTTTIQGMHCNSCATLITMNLEELDGIQSVDINKDSGQTTIDYDESKVGRETITQAITDSGNYHIV